MTSLLVSAEDSPVKCGAVLSPITDFELYGKELFFLLTVPAVRGKQTPGINILGIIRAQAGSVNNKKRLDGDCRSCTFHPTTWEKLDTYVLGMSSFSRCDAADTPQNPIIKKLTTPASARLPEE